MSAKANPIISLFFFLSLQLSAPTWAEHFQRVSVFSYGAVKNARSAKHHFVIGPDFQRVIRSYGVSSAFSTLVSRRND